MSNLKEGIANAVKEIFPLGAPRRIRSLAPRCLQEALIKTSDTLGRMSSPNSLPSPKWAIDQMRVTPSPHPSAVHNRTFGGAREAQPSPHMSGLDQRAFGGVRNAKPRPQPSYPSRLDHRLSGGLHDAKPRPQPSYPSRLDHRAPVAVSDAKNRPQSSGGHNRTSGGVSGSRPSPQPSGGHNRTSGGVSGSRPSPQLSGGHNRTSGGVSGSRPSPQSSGGHNRTSGGVSGSRPSPHHNSPQAPRAPPSTSGGGVRSDAKQGPAMFSNSHSERTLSSHRPQTPSHSPDTCKAMAFYPKDIVDNGGLSGEQMNRDLKVWSPRPQLNGAQPHKFSLPSTPTSRPTQSSLPPPSNMDPQSPGMTPTGPRRHISQKPSHSTPQHKAAGDVKATLRNGGPLSPNMSRPVTALQSHDFLHHREPNPSNDSGRPAGNKSLSLKKRRHTDSGGEDRANKRLRPEEYTSNPAVSRSSPQAYGARNPVVEISNRDPQSASRYSPSRRMVTMSVRSPGRGEGRRQESRREPPRPMSGSNKLWSGSVAAADHCKPPLDRKILSNAFVRLESCQAELNKLETDSYRKGTASISSSAVPSPLRQTSLEVDVASGATVGPAVPEARRVVEESVQTGAGPEVSGCASAGFGSHRNDNANIHNEFPGQTTPLSAPAEPSSWCQGTSSRMETASLNTSLRSPSPSSALDRQRKDEVRKEGQQKARKGLSFYEEASLDVELGLDHDLSLDLKFELPQSSSSSSSEDDQLPTLQQILDRTVRPPDTPVKGTYSSPNTPVGPQHHSLPPESYKTKPTSYKNNLDEMLKDNKSIQRSKEVQTKLRLACEEHLLRLAEEEGEKSPGEAISHEQKEFLQRFSVASGAIRDLHPGEAVFSLENFGRLFNQHTMQLRNCNVTPRNIAQKTLLWSTPDQLSLQVSSGLFQRAYSSSPCPPQVALWLFQMMSVHSDMLTCHNTLKALSGIAFSAADHIVLNKSKQFEVWVPSVADIALVFMNMGVPFVTLFPLEDLQPAFTEGDLIDGIEIGTNRLSTEEQLSTFPEHNFDSVIEYLFLCTSLCPRTYSDRDLLLLITVMSKVGLDTLLALQPKDRLRSLLHNLVNSIKDLDHMLPRICKSLTDLTEDHHNLRWLVQLLPDNMRGKRLRRHLSMSAISKLLNNRCTYRSSNAEFQLSELRRYLPRMRPSSLLRQLADSRSGQDPHGEQEDCAALDQQAYYLCYSLLSLANEATIFEFFPSKQKKQLLLLSAELEKYIKCDIRESEKMLYRSKVKDFVARIYTKWQVLVHKTRPLQGKLYEYWQPLPEDVMSSSQESQQSIKEREDMFMEEEEAEDAKEENEKSLEMDLALEEEEEVLGEKALNIDDEEEEEEGMEVVLEESDEQPKTEDMEEEPTELGKEGTGTDQQESDVENRGEHLRETEDGGKIQDGSEMENRRDPRETEDGGKIQDGSEMENRRDPRETEDGGKIQDGSEMENRRDPRETEDGGKIQDGSEMENRRDPRETEDGGKIQDGSEMENRRDPRETEDGGKIHDRSEMENRRDPRETGDGGKIQDGSEMENSRDPRGNEDGGKIQDGSEMENRRDPRETESESTEHDEEIERNQIELKEENEKQSEEGERR